MLRGSYRNKSSSSSNHYTFLDERSYNTATLSDKPEPFKLCMYSDLPAKSRDDGPVDLEDWKFTGLCLAVPTNKLLILLYVFFK